MNLTTTSVPHLDQYFGVWAIHEDIFRAAVDRVGRMNIEAHVEAHTSNDGEPQAETGLQYKYPIEAGGVAVLRVTGPLMKYTSSLSGGTSTVWLRRTIRAAVNDGRVSAILLRIDSPGGTVAGTQDLANDVAEAAAQKPVYAYIEDLGASAAYWIASQAKKVYCNATAIVGSIGTFAVVHDMSGYAAKEGIKVHVIRAGAMKGAGEPGTEVTAEQLADWQQIVNELNEHFVRGVASGRKMSLKATRELADGRVHIGTSAQERGLVDGVQSFDQVLSQIQRKEAKAMATDNVAHEVTAGGSALESLAAQATAAKEAVLDTRQTAATVAELKASLPDSDAAFREKCIEQGFTLAQAKDAWMEHLRAQNEDLKAQAKRPGVDPVRDTEAKGDGDGDGDGTGASGDAVATFNARVSEKVKAGMDRNRAIAAVVRADPELHQAYLLETNAGNSEAQERVRRMAVA